METKFTKGEWTIDYGHTLGHIKAVLSGRQSTPTVAIYNNRSRLFQQEPSVEELANAKLIAAAPDLLKSCVELIELLHFNGYDNATEISEAREAIKKATE